MRSESDNVSLYLGAMTTSLGCHGYTSFFKIRKFEYYIVLGVMFQQAVPPPQIGKAGVATLPEPAGGEGEQAQECQTDGRRPGGSDPADACRSGRQGCHRLWRKHTRCQKVDEPLSARGR